jgi:acyl carrier protein
MTDMMAGARTAFGTNGASASPALLSETQRIFSDVTRYPVEILEPDANIEEDLGIDSVKLGEIFAVLREKYDLPGMSDLRGELEPSRLRTIAGVAGVVAQYMRKREPAPVIATQEPRSADDLLAEIRGVFSEITRYPLEILEADANLEEDLGIDSVKLGEIFAALRERYGLPPMADLKETVTPDRMRTLGGVAGVIAELVGARPVAAPPVAPPEPAPSNGAHPEVRARGPLDGKIALVTGSKGGLAHGVARHLASLGATTIVDSLQEVESGFAGLDFLVHCGSSGASVSIDRIGSDDWDDAFRTNVVGLHRVALEAIPLMERRGGGRIVVLSTTASDRVVPHAACEGTVNAAVESLSRYLAAELAPHNVRVNCIKMAESSGSQANVCALVTALLSDELSFMTGSTIVLDNGHLNGRDPGTSTGMS